MFECWVSDDLMKMLDVEVLGWCLSVGSLMKMLDVEVLGWCLSVGSLMKMLDVEVLGWCLSVGSLMKMLDVEVLGWCLSVGSLMKMLDVEVLGWCLSVGSLMKMLDVEVLGWCLSVGSLMKMLDVEVLGWWDWAYFYETHKMSFEAAQKYCRTHHTDLVTIRSLQEHDAIQQKIMNTMSTTSSSAWIGLRRTWAWSDQSSSTHRAWGSGQPRLQHSDPCHNYTVLNDPWRATTNLDQSVLKCDKNVQWQGWYLMVHQEVRVRMPNVCVPEKRCGTQIPLWMNGSHPHPEDGIVTREVCGHWHSDCCQYNSTPIQVKACPGNYTVYTFNSPPRCPLAYCADLGNEAVLPTTTPVAITLDLSNEEVLTTTAPAPITSDGLVLVREHVSWHDALAGCKSRGLELVSILSAELAARVRVLARSASTPHVWLGLRYACGLRVWFWVSGWSVCYQDWAPGNRTGEVPQGWGTGALSRTQPQHWVSLHQHTPLNFICSK
ncbi:uncharacterized protein LOC134079076 [Sardina pilchardus]|uniref:uncharacterized protein LOC134079076 n=1 Tax=Sardina pilchardus TaxID=27697 RepID=UPI002E0F8AAA